LQTNLLNGQVRWETIFFRLFCLVAFFSWLSFSNPIDVIPFLFLMIFFVLSKLVMSSKITLPQRARRLIHWFCGLQPLSAEEQAKLVESTKRTWFSTNSNCHVTFKLLNGEFFCNFIN
jgi:predicted membrane protein